MALCKTLDEMVFVNKKGQKMLGAGSFASVNLVHHRDDNTTLYAMKTVEKRTPRAVQLINKEIKLHKRLIHPHVIRFVDHLDLPTRVHIFLEYASNGDLFGYINKRKLSDDECLKFFYQTCEGIRYIHARNIMHRDLKPENILVDEKLNVKVADFGWSAEYFPEENRQTLCGTYEYMAPEIFAKKNQTKKTDVWALGVLLYELFHGHAPFRGTQLDEVRDNISRGKIAFKKTLSPQVKELVIRILCVDPTQRPTTEEIIRSPLIAAFLERNPHLEVQITPPSLSQLSGTLSNLEAKSADENSSPQKSLVNPQTRLLKMKTAEKPRDSIAIIEISKSATKLPVKVFEASEREQAQQDVVKKVEMNPKGLFTPVTKGASKAEETVSRFEAESGPTKIPKTFSNYLRKFL